MFTGCLFLGLTQLRALVSLFYAVDRSVSPGPLSGDAILSEFLPSCYKLELGMVGDAP